MYKGTRNKYSDGRLDELIKIKGKETWRCMNQGGWCTSYRIVCICEIVRRWGGFIWEVGRQKSPSETNCQQKGTVTMMSHIYRGNLYFYFPGARMCVWIVWSIMEMEMEREIDDESSSNRIHWRIQVKGKIIFILFFTQKFIIIIIFSFSG